MNKKPIRKCIYAIFPRLQIRPLTRFLKDYTNNKELSGAEIGLLHGYNAKNILLNLNIKVLYCIDIKILESARILLKDYNVEFIEGNSQKVFSSIPDDLDFVYIDGDHSYSSCLSDIEKYYGKTNVLGGHDYTLNNVGVRFAVNEFVIRNNFE